MPFSQSIRSKTKTNRDLPARVFTRLAPATRICFVLIGLSATVVIGQSDYFGFGFTILH